MTIKGFGGSSGGGGSGSVTSVSVVSANGLAGTVATATTTPAITLSTSVTGILKGNGTAITAAVAGTDYQAPITNPVTGTGVSRQVPFWNTTTSLSGSTTLLYDVNGNLIVGDTAASGRLHVKGSADLVWLDAMGGLGQFNFSNTTEARFINRSNSNMSFWTNTSQKMTINTVGDVGIGVVPSSSGKLNVFATTEQLRLSYDASNYVSETVSSIGGVSFSANGTSPSFGFSTLSGSGTRIVSAGSSGILGIATAGTDYQAPITLTTTGASGAATFTANTLNIPVYAGTVSSVSVVTANGVSGSVATATTTPAITLTLGAITPSSVAATGSVTGSNLSGTNTGDQTSVTGNAGTATALQTARLINGVSFNGTADITVPAAAGTLTGTTLAANVVSSSLTSVGTITTGVWNGTSIPLANGGTAGTSAVTARTNILPTQSGKTNLSLVTNGTDVDFTGNTVLNRVSTIVSTVATGSTQIPADNSIPQNTEGDQYMSLAITPKSATSVLVIEYKAQLSFNAANGLPCAALFQDTTVNALSTAGVWVNYASGAGAAAIGTHIMTSGTTSSTTFKVRAGPSSAITTTFNGSAGSQTYGGTSNSYITITEYAA